VSDLTPLEWSEQPVRIDREAIYFGDTKVPGCIASDGVTFKPGGGTEMNRLTIEFLVGPVTAVDPMAQQKAFDYTGMKVRDGE
jgi:hypothetical protein